MKKQLFFMAMLMAMSLSASAQQQVTISLPRQSFEGWDSPDQYHACGSRQISDIRRWFEC